MPTIDYNGIELELDEEGFLVEPGLWDEDLARFLAEREEGITDLTEDHWKVIHYLNAYYHEHGSMPLTRKLCEATGFKLKTIHTLFPGGPSRGAAKVAGLPKPAGCV